MKLLAVELERFRSFKKKVRFKIPGSGLIYLTGVNLAEPDLEGNAVGKTTLFEGIYWVLFGKTSLKLKGGAVANWQQPKECNGTVWLKRLGIRHKVKRTWKPNSLKLDGREVDQETLEKALGLFPDAFLHSYFFPQKSDSFLDLRPEQKMGLLVDVIGLVVWDKASEVASGKTQELEREISEAEGRLTEVKASMGSMEPGELIEREAKWTREHKEEIHSLKQALDKLKVGNLNDLERELQRCDKELRYSYQTEADAKAVIKLCREELAELSQMGSKCPTCGAKIDRAHMKLEKSKVNKKLARAERVLKSHQAAIDLAEKERTKLRKQRDTADESKDLSRRLDRARAEVNPFTEQREKAERQHFHLVMRKASLRAKIRAHYKELEATKFWIKGFKEVRLLIVDSIIAQLETEVNQSIHELGLQGWAIKFDVERENKSGGISRGFNTLVLSPTNTEPVPWEAWSGGESQRLRLAGMMGFANLINNMTGQKPNMEMWDEPSNWVSSRGIDQMLQALAARAAKYHRAIIVADHRALGHAFDKRITIIKDRRGSRIEGQRLSLAKKEVAKADNPQRSPDPSPVQMGGRIKLKGWCPPLGPSVSKYISLGSVAQRRVGQKTQLSKGKVTQDPYLAGIMRRPVGSFLDVKKR